MRNYESAQSGEHKMINPDLLLMTDKEMTEVVCRFILEVRKKDGTDYPTETLYDLVLSLQLYLKQNGRKVRFLDDDEFDAVRNTLDNRMKYLSSLGNHAKRQSAAIITVEQENEMWDSGVLGEDNPKQFSQTLLYLIGMHFALRAGQEHRNLRVGCNSQFKLKQDDTSSQWYLEYTEDVSKTQQGGLDHKNVKRKVVRAYQNIDNPDRCVVHYWKKSLAVRPKDPNCPEDFYLRPLVQPNANGAWFAMQPIGRQKLANTVSDLAKQAGLTGKVTNHSLRATCASRLYRQSVDEQLICEKTGHRSNAVRGYKRTSSDQMKEMSAILYGNKKRRIETVSVPPKSPSHDDSKVETSANTGDNVPIDSKGPICVNVHVHLK